jgi:site-specific DNA-methyltransferase (adenine-specific)
MDSDGYGTSPITKPATEDAKKWDGWGTALKPTVEPIVMARKPVESTVANNVLTYGTGGLNIDVSRIGTEERTNLPAGNKANAGGVYKFSNAEIDSFNGSEAITVQGRWPANVILDQDAAKIVDEQSGFTKGVARNGFPGGKTFGGSDMKATTGTWYSGEGGASRFFYVAKASKKDRNEGLENLPNAHPTVKPTTLMSYLINLVTPEGGTVLDPFTGSGSTGKAAVLNGFDFIGIEMTEEYLPIIEGRLKHAEKKFAEKKTEKLF